MMNILTKSAIALVLTASVASAQNFADGSNAKGWGLFGEEKATFSGKVVDILCELGGDCADNCGGGERQLAIVRSSDNVMVPVLKNRQTSFNGGIEDLLPYCNMDVDVDGLLVGDAEIANFGAKAYLVQFIRESGAAEWEKASKWTKAWAAKHPEAKGKGPWFRRDPRVAKQIAATGHFGLGLEVDQKYIEDNQ